MNFSSRISNSFDRGRSANWEITISVRYKVFNYRQPRNKLSKISKESALPLSLPLSVDQLLYIA